MPKVVYQGDAAAVDVVLPSGEVVVVAKGSAVDLPDDMAKDMLLSSSWAKPKTAKGGKEQ